jgi:hypothetical protein
MLVLLAEGSRKVPANCGATCSSSGTLFVHLTKTFPLFHKLLGSSVTEMYIFRLNQLMPTVLLYAVSDGGSALRKDLLAQEAFRSHHGQRFCSGIM